MLAVFVDLGLVPIGTVINPQMMGQTSPAVFLYMNDVTFQKKYDYNDECQVIPNIDELNHEDMTELLD